MVSILFRQASVFPPLMFIAQDPQIPVLNKKKRQKKILEDREPKAKTLSKNVYKYITSVRPHNMILAKTKSVK